MEWQLEAITKLLATPRNEVEAGERVYLSSGTYGNSRYHLINKRYDGIQVEQIHIDEQWAKRINLYTDELPAFLATLLNWYLEQVKSEQVKAEQDADALGDLRDKPF